MLVLALPGRGGIALCPSLYSLPLPSPFVENERDELDYIGLPLIIAFLAAWLVRPFGSEKLPKDKSKTYVGLQVRCARKNRCD